MEAHFQPKDRRIKIRTVCQMRLHRYTIVTFEPHLRGNTAIKAADVGNVQVFITGRLPDEENKKADRRVFTATLRIAALPDRDENNRLLIPDEPRKECEIAAEHMANLLAVAENVSRSILSPVNYVALEWETEKEKAFLESSEGIFRQDKPEAAVHHRIEFTPEIGKAIADRMSGVALLAEALSSGSPAGEYRDYARFIELAFKLPSYDQRLRKKLAQFLAGTVMKYTREELDEWLNLRHPSVHADAKRTSWIALSEDLRHVTLRMRQACLDILFNKEHWHSASSGRRAVWKPTAYSTASQGNLVVIQGTQLPMLFRTLDHFGSYPINLQSNVTDKRSTLYFRYSQMIEPKFDGR